MKIDEMRKALTPEEVLPEMMVVEVDNPEQYVECKGLETANKLNELITGENHAIEHYQDVMKDQIDILADNDLEALKKMVGQMKANIIILTEMATKYDKTDVSKSAAKSLKKLLKSSK